MAPSPGAIGSFVIGESAIGEAPFDWRTTVLSQYANSPTILQLIDNFSQYLDATGQIDNFYDMVWNVASARGWGLDVWGRIVGVGRALSVTTKYFGFAQAGTVSADPFGQSPFYSGEALTANFLLTDSAFRQLIYAKALANICGGSIPDINQILLLLFGEEGVCYVTDGQDMTMTYTFEFEPTPVDLAIIRQSGVFPRPTGVASTIVIV